MNIQADKFLALTAMLAGFVPASGCSITIDGSATANDSNSGDATTDGVSATGTDTGATTQGEPTSTSGASATDGTSTDPGTTAMTTAMTEDVPTTGATTSTGTSTTGEGTSTGGVEHDCCEVKNTPGCSDTAIQECVCAEDPICCGLDDGFWDSICVGLVNSLGCAMCDIGDTTGEGDSSGGSTGP